MKEDVMTSKEIAEREKGARTKQVVEWLNKVETIEKEANEIKKSNCKRSRSVWSNYETSTSAIKKLREMQSLGDQKDAIEVTLHLPPPLAQEMPASSSISPSLRLALHYVKDNMHCIIGLWGMGGVGKTHLLKQINNELCKGSTFNVVVSVTCSKESSEEKVQNEIINKLGLIKSDSVEQKQSTIFNFLKQKSFVLLLDDLWSRMNLETVGIPTPYGIVDNCKRKVVLTTRSEEVCQLMEVDKKMRVNVLDWNGAWSVFKENVSEHTIESHPFILKFAVDVVKELGGLPLALITVGKAMNNRTDPSEWKDAVELLKQACLHDVELLATDKPMFEVLKFSYDKLQNDNLRQCFLHCSLWPEDFLIDKNDLVELWMGLGLIDERDITKAY